MAYTAGAVVAKPADACKFTKLLWTGNIISDSSLNIMKQCTNLALSSSNVNRYGYGAQRFLFNGKTYFGHNGDISGFTIFGFKSPPTQSPKTLAASFRACFPKHFPSFLKLFQDVYLLIILPFPH